MDCWNNIQIASKLRCYNAHVTSLKSKYFRERKTFFSRMGYIWKLEDNTVVGKVSANQRRCYICNIICHWLRPCWVIDNRQPKTQRLSFISCCPVLALGHAYWVIWYFNSVRPSDAIWWHRARSTLAQAMACCLMAPSDYLNQCLLIISEVQWHSCKGNFTWNATTSKY